MTTNTYEKIAIKYIVDDIQAAILPSTMLSNILKILEEDTNTVSKLALSFLIRKNFLALLTYSKAKCSFEEYLVLAKDEKSRRYLDARKEEQYQVALQEERNKAAFERRLAYDNDLKNIAKAKRSKLRDKYNLSDFIEKDDLLKLMKILQKVDNKTRLTDEDFIWLTVEGKKYFTKELKESYHCIEGDFYATEFKIKKDPWLAVNVSKHYRKCGKSDTADSILTTIKVSTLNNIKLRSALLTTHGGVKRDLGKPLEAISLGESAHRLTKKDFRPCTLLGAVNMENGHFEAGQSWYAKAIENGFSERAMDHELKAIYKQLTKSQKESLQAHLLHLDSKRYSWIKKA